MESCNNIVIISADRNGSTAFQQDLLGANLNNDHLLWMGECFSQDPNKNQPPTWYDPGGFRPRDVISAVNAGTGKNVILKIQITYPNFSSEFLGIAATRRIFFHRNLFDSTLRRCIAQLTGHWFRFDNESYDDLSIPLEFFSSRLQYRISCYQTHLDPVLEWANEIRRYEMHEYGHGPRIKPNPNKRYKVTNYDNLYNHFLGYNEIGQIERRIDTCLTIT